MWWCVDSFLGAMRMWDDGGRGGWGGGGGAGAGMVQYCNTLAAVSRSPLGWGKGGAGGRAAQYNLWPQ